MVNRFFSPISSSRARNRGLSLLICLGWLALATGCGGEAAPAKEILRPVRSQIVEMSGTDRTRTFSGIAQAGRETELAFRVAGSLRTLSISVGDRVRRGQLIATLDRRDFDLQVEQARATLAQVEATRRNGESNLQRARELWENNNISQNEYDSTLAQAESARAQVVVAQKALESAEQQLAYTRLSAPTAGAIAQVSVEVGENLSSSRTVALLTSGGQTEVEVAMPETWISSIRSGQTVDVKIPALDSRTFPATVTEVGVAATGTATTFPVTVRINEEDPDLRSGMAADVSFVFPGSGRNDLVYLPSEAVGEDREGRFVFLVQPESEGVATVQRQSVEVGELTQDGIQIMSGLLAGQEVVTAGVRRLVAGQRVRKLGSVNGQ